MLLTNVSFSSTRTLIPAIMAKYILLPAAIVLFFCTSQQSYAQELPAAGTNTFEVLVSPFANNPVTFNEVRFRRFRSDDTALRLRADLDYRSEREDEDFRDTRFDFSVAPGMEWHFMQNSPISVFYGAEIPIRYVTTREHGEDAQGESFTNKNTRGDEHFGIGVGAFAGIDFHFLDMLYAGMEVRYRIQYRSYLDGEIGNTTFDNDARDFLISSAPVGQFRFGITF